MQPTIWPGGLLPLWIWQESARLQPQTLALQLQHFAAWPEDELMFRDSVDDQVAALREQLAGAATQIAISTGTLATTSFATLSSTEKQAHASTTWTMPLGAEWPRPNMAGPAASPHPAPGVVP